MTDIEIARSINPKNVTEVAKELGIEDKIELYGNDKAKISLGHIWIIHSRIIIILIWIPQVQII